jgi:biotin carboxyl carrier protein
MRIEVEIEGKSYALDVVLEQGFVTLGVARYPAKVVRNDGTRVELEIDGEKVLVEGWPPKSELPPGRLSVNGEVVLLGRVLRGAATPTTASAGPATPVPVTDGGAGVAVRPPMPGKLLELRVKDGDSVKAGQVILVLEAMKMRNEVAAPTAGIVRGISVEPGASVRANDVLLRIVPA